MGDTSHKLIIFSTYGPMISERCGSTKLLKITRGEAMIFFSMLKKTKTMLKHEIKSLKQSRLVHK